MSHQRPDARALLEARRLAGERHAAEAADPVGGVVDDVREHVGHARAHGRRRVDAQHLAEGHVHRQEAVVHRRAGLVHFDRVQRVAAGQVLEQQPVALLAVALAQFQRLHAGDVDPRAVEAVRMALERLGRHQRHAQLEQPRRGEHRPLELLAPAAEHGLDARLQRGVTHGVDHREDLPQRLADQAVGGQPHGGLEVAVHEPRDGVAIPVADQCGRVVDHRIEVRMRAAELRFQQSRRGHVLEHGQRARGAAVVVALQRGRQQHVDRVPSRRTNWYSMRSQRPSRKNAGNTTSRAYACDAGVRKSDDGTADHFVALVAHQREPAVAHVEEAAVRPDRVQDRGRGLVQAAHAQLALGQLAGWWRAVGAAASASRRRWQPGFAASFAGARPGGAAPGRSRTPCRCARRRPARWERRRRSGYQGSPMTSGLAAKRASSVASATSNKAESRMAWSQKATSRGVSSTPGRPTLALNHWRCASISEISAIGTPHNCAAVRVIVSKAGSGRLSSTPSSRSAARRLASSTGVNVHWTSPTAAASMRCSGAGSMARSTSMALAGAAVARGPARLALHGGHQGLVEPHAVVLVLHDGGRQHGRQVQAFGQQRTRRLGFRLDEVLRPHEGAQQACDVGLTPFERGHAHSPG
jgi:hypothetical protein